MPGAQFPQLPWRGRRPDQDFCDDFVGSDAKHQDDAGEAKGGPGFHHGHGGPRPAAEDGGFLTATLGLTLQN